MDRKTCLWHKCAKSFQPEHVLTRFCSKECQKNRANWKSVRGSTLVDLLLSGDANGLMLAKRKIEKEIQENTP
jgi:hypothetical protein